MTDKPAKKFLVTLYQIVLYQTVPNCTKLYQTVPMNNPAQCELKAVQQTIEILNQTDEFLLKSVF